MLSLDLFLLNEKEETFDNEKDITNNKDPKVSDSEKNLETEGKKKEKKTEDDTTGDDNTDDFPNMDDTPDDTDDNIGDDNTDDSNTDDTDIDNTLDDTSTDEKPKDMFEIEKKKKLLESYKKLYNDSENLLNQINNIMNSCNTSEYPALQICGNNLIKVQQILYRYITEYYNNKSYEENLYYYISTIESIKLLDKIVDKIVQIRNKH